MPRTLRLRLVSFLAVVTLLLFTSKTWADTLTPGTTIELDFTIAADASADVLELTGNGLSGFQGAQVQLFDGATLLGTAPSDGDGLFANWRSATSLFNIQFTDTIDFSSLQNGTIAGRIDITPGYVFPAIVPTIAPGSFALQEGTGTADNSFQLGPAATITGVTLLPPTSAPEPGTVWMLACGLVAMGLCHRRMRRAFAVEA